MATATMSEIELQKEIFDKISNNDTIGLKTLLSSIKAKIQCVDEHGMSPLQYACFKGNKEMAQMLLDQVRTKQNNNNISIGIMFFIDIILTNCYYLFFIIK